MPPTHTSIAMTAADVQPRETCGDHWKRWKPWLIKNYLVLGFVFVIVLALSWPLPGRELEFPQKAVTSPSRKRAASWLSSSSPA